MGSGLNRRDFMALTGSGVVAGMAGMGSGPLAAAQQGKAEDSSEATSGPSCRPGGRPNLILFMPDEMRADSLSCYGNPVTKTPNLDKVAREGARFSNCHVQFPVCGASRCSLLTGWPTHVRGHRSLYYFLRPEEPNLFRYLKNAGYDVYFFGSHNDALATTTFADSVTEWNPAAGHGINAIPSGASINGLITGATSFLYGPSGDRRDTYDYNIVKMAIDVLNRKEAGRPFCIFLPMLNPHPPYTICEDFYKLYSPSDMPDPIPANLPKRPSFHQGIREFYGLSKLSNNDYRRIRSVYYGQVSYVDWLLGELLEAVEKTNHEKDTALFVFSDHGDYTGDYGLVEKWPSGLEDCLTHVPLIVHAPGFKSGIVGEEMVELYDVMATALDLAGTKAHHTHFARSLVPQMSGMQGDSKRAAYAEGGYNIYEPQCFEPYRVGNGPYAGKIRLQNERPVSVSRSAMVRTRDHKLILRTQDQSELYRYKDDPREMNNLYGDRSVAEVQRHLELMLAQRYLNTSGIAPMDKDLRDTPPFMPTRSELAQTDWQESILDT